MPMVHDHTMRSRSQARWDDRREDSTATFTRGM